MEINYQIPSDIKVDNLLIQFLKFGQFKQKSINQKLFQKFKEP